MVIRSQFTREVGKFYNLLVKFYNLLVSDFLRMFWRKYCWNWFSFDGVTGIQQELSYRKQISRHMCTQYFEGICNNPVTLVITQDHWNWSLGRSRTVHSHGRPLLLI